MGMDLPLFSSWLDFVTRTLRISTCLVVTSGRLGKERNSTEAGKCGEEAISQMFHLQGAFHSLPLDSGRTLEGLALLRACRQRYVLSLSSAKHHITLNLSLWNRVSA